MATFPVPDKMKHGAPQTNGNSKNASSNDTEDRRNNPIHHERSVRVICIGAGASGLLFAYKLQRHFDNFSLTVYEKNSEVSGTWFENRYPGCACDIPAHNYTWTFEPNHDWSAVYSGSHEIYKYFDKFAHKYELHKFVKTRHEIVGATWSNARDAWDVDVKDLASGTTIHDQCDFLINASGVLNNWKWPKIEGLFDYKGTLLHTANWDDNVNLEGKRVGLIGNGSSGIQVLPTVQPKVEHITTFFREPTWISPVQGMEQHFFTDEERDIFKNKPGALLEYRKKTEANMNGQFGIFMRDSPINNATHENFVAQMKEKINDEKLASQLIPKWSVGCRRLTPGVGYLECLTKPNVTAVHGGVVKITENACIDSNGDEHEIDVLICATGFDTTFRPRFPVVASNGKNLQDEWSKEAKSYLGLAAADVDNYFIFLGPNCPIGNGPVLPAIEAQAEFMLKMIDHWQTHNVKKLSPKLAVVDEFIAHKNEFVKGTVWVDECRSWYKAGKVDGPVTALWPGSTMHYLEALLDVRMQDFNIEYHGNRFAYLGNGSSQTEADLTADWAYYIRDHDDGPWLSRGKARKELTRSGTVSGRSAVTEFSFARN